MTKFIAGLFALALCAHLKETTRNTNGEIIKIWGDCSAVWISPNKALTAAHCFGPDTIDTWLKDNKGQSAQATLLATDHQEDLALVQVNTPVTKWVTLGKLPEVGDQIEIVSNPGGVGLLYSEGIVEGYLEETPLDHRLMVGSAMIARGSSGGPVFNKKGQLVGIVEVLFNSSGGMAGYIPIDVVKQFLKENKELL